MTIYSNFFSYMSLFTSKIYTNTFKTKNSKMVVFFFFSRYRLSNGQPILYHENLEYFDSLHIYL